MKTLVIIIAVALCPLCIFSQSLDVQGQAKIAIMDSDSTAQNIVVWQDDGTLAVRDAATITPALPQSPNPGEMTFWDGTAWVSVPTGTDGQTLTLCDGVPTWTTDGFCFNEVSSITGKIWMDSNLGASQVATSSTDAASYGDLYQWGRGGDGHQDRSSGTTTTLSTTDQPGHGDFITTSAPLYDWRSGQNDNLWQGVNGINNPCPNGFRIPTDAEWDEERLSWNTNDSAGAFGSPLKLPDAGFRRSGTGAIFSVGLVGTYWSSTVDGINSRLLNFGSSGAATSIGDRAVGASVRCIKD